jgi:hypothetical protein
MKIPGILGIPPVNPIRVPANQKILPFDAPLINVMDGTLLNVNEETEVIKN